MGLSGLNVSMPILVCLLVAAAGRAEGKCSITQFQCANGIHCVDKEWVCDGEGDCPDDSDELSCSQKNICPETQLRCKNGRCLTESWLCDGQDDCGDNTDESDEHCANRKCTKDEFRCKEPDGRCLKKRFRCDGRSDCKDGSDENGCTRPTCSSVQFECLHGGCISIRWVCDGDEDCYDASDEVDCGPKNCSSKHFQCTNGKCAMLDWVCDGRDDCGDQSDELDCPHINRNLTCNETQFQCADGSTCVSLQWKCDGAPDCWDGSDERNCAEECQDDQYQCHAGECIGAALECDGKPDCADGTDEHPRCTEIIAKQTPCNTSFEFDCGSNHCIPLSSVCDNKNDCGDNQDEGEQCGKNECLEKNGGCHDICTDLKIGFRCECSKPGFKLGADNQSCHDIDECTEVPGACSQFCNNTKGGFKCSCSVGYVLEPNNRVCRAEGPTPKLIFTDKHDVRMVDLVTNDYRDVLSELRIAAAIDYKYDGGIVVWSDGVDGEILRATFESNVSTSLVTRGSKKFGTVGGLAVDWIHDKIYWTDTGRDEICVAELMDGRHVKTLISTHLQEARAIVVDPQSGWMFWADWGISRIEKAGMDGSHRSTLVDTDIRWPNGLAIDRHDNQLYWIDAKLHTITRCDLNGANRQIIVASRMSFGHPYDIDVFEDLIYFSDWHMHRIFSAHKVTGENVSIVAKAPTPMSLAVVHEMRQPKFANRCLNHTCSQLCLASPTTSMGSLDYTCLCGNGFRLAEDGSNCDKVNLENPPSEGGHDAAKDGGEIAATVIAVLSFIACAVALASYFAYRRFKSSRHLRAINFDNPVYRKTTEDQFSLEKPGSSSAEPLDTPGTNEFI